MAIPQQGDARTGVVVRLIRDKGFGFLRDDQTGEERFFHRSALRNADFDSLTDSTKVQFQEGTGDKGPRAEQVYVL